jgi:hypothetical protein
MIGLRPASLSNGFSPRQPASPPAGRSVWLAPRPKVQRRGARAQWPYIGNTLLARPRRAFCAQARIAAGFFVLPASVSASAVAKGYARTITVTAAIVRPTITAAITAIVRPRSVAVASIVRAVVTIAVVAVVAIVTMTVVAVVTVVPTRTEVG